MIRFFLYIVLTVPAITFGKNIQIKDGLYYSYWVYKDNGVLKEYDALANNPKKEMGKYSLTPTPDYSAADEIYLQVKGGNPVVYYYHSNSGASLNTIGWAGAKFSSNGLVILENTIQMVSGDTKDNVYVGVNFPGKLVKLESDEVVPLKLIDDDTFEVDCNIYLDANGYRDSGIPDYEELDPKGREGIGLSYPATVFSVGELGICAAFLDEDVVPQIKNGWIQFRRLN
jgi:hypothetical protein